MNTIHNLPRPGAPMIDNLVATLLINGNSARNLKLDVIARYQGIDPADLTARFAQLETEWSLKPCGECEK